MKGGAVQPIPFRAEMEIDFAAEKPAAFDEAWRLLRDPFYDPRFRGPDWKEVRALPSRGPRRPHAPRSGLDPLPDVRGA